ncbi:uncharacterized protein LOC141858822 [Acropora palmata]|uniref:uncharacterized protein LOC141858822 n=1 Tax=Acropora palmata TaxID=6131 RepID=UPI003DA10D14
MGYLRNPVLGPCCSACSKLFDITSAHLPEVHCYVDDTQLYMSFRPNATSGSDEAIFAMMTCIADIRDWMISDKLMLNDSKTEILLVGTRQQLCKVDLDALQIGTSTVPLTSLAIHGFAPSYLFEVITVKESQPYSLRSSSELLLRMPSRITKKTLGDRAFQVAALRLWNSLPGELRRKSDLEEFKSHLKAHLFSKPYL